MTRQSKTTFSPEFKREAVQLLESGEKDAAQLARELGVRRNQLYKWKEEIDRHGDTAFPGSGKRTNKSGTADNTRVLQQEIKRLREENEILKKAAIFFAKESG